MISVGSVLSIVFPVFLSLCVGMFCRVRRMLDAEGIAALKKVAVNICLPAVSLGTFARADYSSGRLLIPIWIFIACALALILGFGAQKLLKMQHSLSPYLCTCFEGGMLGFSLYPLIYGDLSPFAIVVMGQTFFIFTVYKIMLAGARGGRALLHEAITSPSLWALALGVLLGVSGLYARMADVGLQTLFDTTLSFVSAPTSFLILLTIGYDLKPIGIQWGETVKVVLARVVIMLVLLGATLLVNRTLLGGMIEIPAAVMLFILPPPYVLPAFSKKEEEAGFLSSSISIMTLLTIIGFTLMAIFAG